MKAVRKAVEMDQLTRSIQDGAAAGEPSSSVNPLHLSTLHKLSLALLLLPHHAQHHCSMPVPQPPPSSDNTNSPTLHQDCECVFHYVSHCWDGTEWIKCACTRCVHENCIDDVFLGNDGLERFCPFCFKFFPP